MRYGGLGEGVYGGTGQLLVNPQISNGSFTGQSQFADGAVGTPSITFTSDPDTGFYWGSTGIFRVATNGAQSSYFNTQGISANSFDIGLSGDNFVGRVGAQQIRFAQTASATGVPVTTTSRSEINKAVTAFTNAVAKTVFTVTVPNAAHHAVIELEVQGALGAGGAIGAGEAMATNTYKIAIVRTAGVATVATATAATHAVAVAVAGAATVTATAAVSAMSGAVGATQTFTIDVTISRSGGASDNHTCLAYAKLMNANASGVTIA